MNVTHENISDEELMKLVNEILPIQNTIRNLANKNLKLGFDLPILDFFKLMATILPQSYGSRVENRLSNDLGLISTNNKNRGDKMSANGKYFEWKGSFITTSNDALNLVQIRPWHDVYYVCYCCDFKDIDNINFQLFLLDKSQMELECVAATPCHGTKEANLLNINKELSVRFKKNSNKYVQWVKNYGVSLEKLKKFIDE